MKMTFVTPTPPDVAAFGVRALSAYLKREGKEVRNVFLPGGVKEHKHHKGFVYRYEDPILAETVELCKGSDIVGISFMTNYFDRAVQLTEAIRGKLGIPVVWGGIHPTVAPEESIRHADMICIGEGEEALAELLEKMESGREYRDTMNFWFNEGGRVRKNPPRPLVQDLDSLPYFDFGTEDQFIYDHPNNSISPMSNDLLKKCFPLEPNVEGSFSDSYHKTVSFKVMTTRGCPHHCTFCAERTLSELYRGQRYLRKRSVGHIIGELTRIREQLPFIESIFLFDDTFTARTNQEIVEFSRQFKEKIGLPFHIQASPQTLNREKMDAMVEGGLVFVEMGIQSTSDTGRNVYKRSVPNEVLLEKVNLLHDYLDKIYPPCYHVILDNPWERTSDVLETLRVILRFPAPFWLKRASLVCFPGTELYLKAKAEGIIRSEEDEKRQIYSKHLHMPEGNYPNFLMYLAGFSRFPRWILRRLATNGAVSIFDRKPFSKIYTGLNIALGMSIIGWKGVRALFTGDFTRIYKFLKGWYT